MSAGTRAGIAPFAIGIGINQGDVLGGNIGSQEKADPTVIGDAVNLASRLEGLTRTYAVDIILGPTATEFVRDEVPCSLVARVQVKGKSEPVEIATLIGARNEEIDPEFCGISRPTRKVSRNSGSATSKRRKSLLAVPRILPDRSPREDVSGASARIRERAAGRSLERGRGLQEEVISGSSCSPFARLILLRHAETFRRSWKTPAPRTN